MSVEQDSIELDGAMKINSFFLKALRIIAVAVFGVALPLVIARGVDSRIDHAQKIVTEQATRSYIIDEIHRAGWKERSGNDYALLAFADSERANLAVMVNKQIMKLVVIYMGFAVMSFAMMFVVMGFTDGAVTSSGEGAGFKFNLQTGSIGATMFVLGATMSAAGGLLKNEFRTVGLPTFVNEQAAGPNFKGRVAEFAYQCAKINTESGQAQCLIATLADVAVQQNGSMK